MAICRSASRSIKPVVFTDSNVNMPELIIRSLPDDMAGENGTQNQSMNHMFRYNDVLVNTITHKLKTESILPMGR